MVSFRIGKLWAQKRRKFLREHISHFVLERIVIKKKSKAFIFLDNSLILKGAEYLVIRLGTEASSTDSYIFFVCVVGFVFLYFGFKNKELHLTFL